MIKFKLRRVEQAPKNVFVEMAAGAPKDQAIYEDIFWSLLNSTEFVFNH